MGERNNINLMNDGIYLYSHWEDKESLKEILKQALIRGKDRWKDRQYLNRIIFSEMIKNNVLDNTGYGLSSELYDGDVCFDVDVDKNEVNGISFIEFIMETYLIEYTDIRGNVYIKDIKASSVLDAQKKFLQTINKKKEYLLTSVSSY